MSRLGEPGAAKKGRGTMMVRRFLAAVAVAGVIVSATSGSALARGPKWTFLPVPEFSLDSTYCPFALDLVPVKNQEYGKSVTNTDNSVTTLITGALSLTIAREDTGRSLTVNVSGPAKITSFPDGSAAVDAHGNTLVFTTAADAARLGYPSEVFVWAGRIVQQLDTQGVVSATFRGHLQVDVCRALA